jgi:hypothetical protein
LLPNEWEISEGRVPNTPRWEGDLVDRTTGVHRNSHSASREQPQSRRTGERSIRRNIPFEPSRVYKLSVPDATHVPFSTRYFEALTVLAMCRRTARLRLIKPIASRSKTSRQNVVPPRSVRHTAYLKDDKGRRAGAEGIWSPPAQQGNYQRKLPRRAGNGGAQRSRSGP